MTMITLKVLTDWPGATYEEEIPYTGQSHKEIEALLEAFREKVVGELDYEYEIDEDE